MACWVDVRYVPEADVVSFARSVGLAGSDRLEAQSSLLLREGGVEIWAGGAQKIEIRFKQRNSKIEVDALDLDMRSKQWSRRTEGWVSFKATEVSNDVVDFGTGLDDGWVWGRLSGRC